MKIGDFIFQLRRNDCKRSPPGEDEGVRSEPADRCVWFVERISFLVLCVTFASSLFFLSACNKLSLPWRGYCACIRGATRSCIRKFDDEVLIIIRLKGGEKTTEMVSPPTCAMRIRTFFFTVKLKTI